MNVPELINPAPREDLLASGPFVVEAELTGEPVQSVGFELKQADGALSWWTDHLHTQQLKGALRTEGGHLTFTRDDDVVFTLRPMVPGDGALVHVDDYEYLEQEPEAGQQALISTVINSWLEDRGAPRAPESDQTDLTLALDSAGQPVGLFRLSSSTFPVQRVDGAWQRLAADADDDVFGSTDVDARPEVVDAWDRGDAAATLAACTDAYSTAPPFERLFLVTEPDANEDEGVVALYAERTRGRLYRRVDRNWELADRREVTLSPSLDVTTGAISAWDDGHLSSLTNAEQYDLNGDTL